MDNIPIILESEIRGDNTFGWPVTSKTILFLATVPSPSKWLSFDKTVVDYCRGFKDKRVHDYHGQIVPGATCITCGKQAVLMLILVIVWKDKKLDVQWGANISSHLETLLRLGFLVCNWSYTLEILISNAAPNQIPFRPRIVTRLVSETRRPKTYWGSSGTEP